MYTVDFRTLTPLWTGDLRFSGKTLRETGIIGSLRWWYEVLIEGLGGTACDPTASSCERKNHCDVCELFGCTGWSRKFRVEVTVDKNIYLDSFIGVRSSRTWGRTRPFSGIVTVNEGPISLTFIPLRKVTPTEWQLLNQTINMIEKYGALGARTAQGNGVIKIAKNDLECIEVSNHGESLVFLGERNVSKSKERSYDLKNFVFWSTRIVFTNSIEELYSQRVFWIHSDRKQRIGLNNELRDVWDSCHILPIGFHVRDAIREAIRNSGKDNMNLVGSAKMGSRVFVSHGYRNGGDGNSVNLRVFGFLTDVERKLLHEEIENWITSPTLLSKYLFALNQGNDLIKRVELIEPMKTGEEIIEEIKREMGVG
ncbi:MAG: type III-B CRISPR module RAMP protein Cmr1 [Limnochordia bacterium]|jgi:CRISPR-associated protein Cmr1|nr:type III-B CRISPR module RAMP protein Cmr1 [Limnochordia bacterium]MDD4519252.1 type III-B CRISPR module RAMP protein Cmr1 [Limnochordia bacterium]